MKHFNIFILLMMVLSSCVFGDKPDKAQLQFADNMEGNNTKGAFIRDSIKVNTTIGDFHVFYRISEFESIRNKLADRYNNETEEVYKTILLNIQKTDTTSILAYKTIDIIDFNPILEKQDRGKYFIDSFYLKEVNRDSIVFNTKLCMFDENLCQNIDLMIKDNGIIIYRRVS